MEIEDNKSTDFDSAKDNTDSNGDSLPPFVVHGTVRQADGTPSPRLTVRAFNRKLRTEDLLGKGRTDQTGNYRITYTSRRFAASGETDSADLIVRAYAPTSKQTAGPIPLAESPTIFNAPADATVNLVIGNQDYRGPAEFNRILAAIRPLLQKVPITDLTEDDTHHDISFLSGETGFDAQRLTVFVKAHRFEQQTKVPGDAFYGMLRKGLPDALPSLLKASPDSQVHALVQAVADNLIAGKSAEEISGLVVALRGSAVAVALDGVAAPTSQAHSLSDLLSVATPDAQVHSALLNAYVQNQGTVQDFWKNLGQDPLFKDPALVGRLQLMLQLGALTANAVPVVQTLPGPT